MLDTFLAPKRALHLQKWVGGVGHSELAKIDICQTLLFGYSSGFKFKPTGQSHNKMSALNGDVFQ